MTQFARNAQQDAPWVWFHAGALSLSLLLMLGLLGFIGYQAVGYFWPKRLQRVDIVLEGGQRVQVWGQHYFSQEIPRVQSQLQGLPLNSRQRLLFLGDRPEEPPLESASVTTRQRLAPYLWVNDATPSEEQPPATESGLTDATLTDVALIQLHSERRLLMKPEAWLDQHKQPIIDSAPGPPQAPHVLSSNTALAGVLRLDDPTLWPSQAYFVQLMDAQQQQYALPITQIAWAIYPNRLTMTERLSVFAHRISQFFSGADASQQQGVWPAIIGTLLMVFLMTLLVTPLGICAAICLHEYAPKNQMTRLVRVGVSNMAAVPSIVYGVFGLGFFVHAIGSALDKVTGQTTPVWETPGLLWAGLTLALMTLPVVIITTEEGLARVPVRLREASFALGATQAETLWKVVLPLVTPAMMTGVILAIARAAGEVAPLMLVGVVKLAPTLPIGERFPYVHLDQPFMHLGYHIYETALFDPRGDVARPLVYAMAALLVLVIVFLNLFAIRIRQRMRDRYRMLDV